MFERFTDRGRRALVLAQVEARLMGHDHIGTEHLLVGLIHEREGIAARALMEFGITLEGVRERVEETVGRTVGEPTGSAPFTPRMKKVLELSLRESLQLGHSYIGTEHLLLGLVREGEGLAVRVLQDLGLELPLIRQSVIQVLSDYQGKGPGEAGAPVLDSSDSQPDSLNSPRCGGCSADLELVLRYRSIKIPPTSPNPFPLRVDVIFCNRCGQVVSTLRAESRG